MTEPRCDSKRHPTPTGSGATAGKRKAQQAETECALNVVARLQLTRACTRCAQNNTLWQLGCVLDKSRRKKDAGHIVSVHSVAVRRDIYRQQAVVGEHDLTFGKEANTVFSREQIQATQSSTQKLLCANTQRKTPETPQIYGNRPTA